MMEQERFQPAAMALVTQVATKLDCDRVSLGFEDRKKLRVKALSHSARRSPGNWMTTSLPGRSEFARPAFTSSECARLILILEYPRAEAHA